MPSHLNDDALIEAQILSDPVYFAEIFLRSHADKKEPLVLSDELHTVTRKDLANNESLVTNDNMLFII